MDWARQLQDETGNVYVLEFGAPYIQSVGGIVVYVMVYTVI